MASFNFEPLWSLMSQYSFQIDLECFDENLLCVICKKLLIDAYQSLCGCRYCHQCIVNFAGNGKKYCPGGNLSCKEEYLNLDTDLVKDRRSNNKIYRLKVKCPNKYCELYVEIAEMSDHLRICSKKVILCPYGLIGCDNESMIKDEVLAHLSKETFEHSNLLIEWTQTLKNEVELLKNTVGSNQSEIKSLRVELAEKDNKINILEQKLNELLERGNIMKNSLKNESIFKSLTGGNSSEAYIVQKVPSAKPDFVWSINSCSMNSGLTKYSECFYSHDYKFCLCFFIYGNSVGLNCVIMPGKNDHKLVWPMNKTVTLNVMNHDTMSPYKSSTFQYNIYNNKSAFFRPRVDQRNYIGANPFLIYSEIKDIPNVIVNDTIIVSCVISDL